VSRAQDWEVWFADESREEARKVDAYSSDEAASEFVEECDLDSETHETIVCVAPVGSDEIETFTLTSEYERYWYAERWPDPLNRFGDVLAEVARWIERAPVREAEEAKFRAECAESAVRRAQRNALYIVSDLGRAISLALAARGKLLALGIADEDHERVVAAHFALTDLARAQR